MSAIRTWTLSNDAWHFMRFMRASGPAIREPVRVIEADPTLDLLERAYNTTKSVSLVKDLEPLLRVHGRLGGET
jgi:hypothetical protein